MTNIEHRIAAVERQLRSHRLLIAGLLVALVALVSYGATKGVPDVIRAKRFEAVNTEGKRIIVLDSFAASVTALAQMKKVGDTLSPSVELTPLGLLIRSNVAFKPFANRPSTEGWPESLKSLETWQIAVVLGRKGLKIGNDMGQSLVSVTPSDNGGSIFVWNKTGEDVIHMYADKYGMGYVGAFDRQGKGRTLTPR